MDESDYLFTVIKVTGIGKSTVSVNLALALHQLGARVGIVDADILGPSIRGMPGIPNGQPPKTTPDGRMIPKEREGLKVVSMGMVSGYDQPAFVNGYSIKLAGAPLPSRHLELAPPSPLPTRRTPVSNDALRAALSSTLGLETADGLPVDGA